MKLEIQELIVLKKTTIKVKQITLLIPELINAVMIYMRAERANASVTSLLASEASKVLYLKLGTRQTKNYT